MKICHLTQEGKIYDENICGKFLYTSTLGNDLNKIRCWEGKEGNILIFLLVFFSMFVNFPRFIFKKFPEWRWEEKNLTRINNNNWDFPLHPSKTPFIFFIDISCCVMKKRVSNASISLFTTFCSVHAHVYVKSLSDFQSNFIAMIFFSSLRKWI